MRGAAFLVILVATVETGCATPYGEEPDVATQPAGTDPSIPAPAGTAGEKSGASTPAPAPSSAPASSSDTSSIDTTTSSAKSAPPPPPSAVTLSWNRVTSTAQYSLDVLPKGQPWVAPCVNVDVIDRGLTVTFDGTCVTPGSTFALGDVDDFRICWAEGGDWPHAKCRSADWDGASPTIALTLAD